MMSPFEEFIWFFGVVEDTSDPLTVGRVRVRCFHYHTADLKLLPVKDLPWAQVIQGSSFSSVGDAGFSGNGLQTGTWVFGFFADGQKKQKPFVIGSVPGIPVDPPDNTKGFSDPQGIYPARFGEPDQNRLSKNDAEKHTTIQFRDALVDDLTGEPIPNRDTTYPLNNVWETAGGHIIEMDDTPGANRMVFFHNAGTFQEVHPNGARVDKVMADNYQIILGNDNIRVRGDVKIFVDGNSTIYTRKNAELQVDGDLRTYVGGNCSIDVAGTYSVKSGGAMRHETKSTYDINSKGAYSSKSSEVLISSANGDVIFNSSADMKAYYCKAMEFLNVCVSIDSDDISLTTKEPYPLVEEAKINYGSERTVYASPGGGSVEAGNAPKEDGGPMAGSVLPPTNTSDKDNTAKSSSYVTDSDETLGSLSARYESNGNPCAIGRDSTGGYSWGKYQIATKVGTFRSFMSYLAKNYSEFFKKLQAGGGNTGATAGSSDFRKVWAEVCSDEEFSKAQHNFIQATHYEHSKRTIGKLGLNIDERSKSLRDVVWSTSVQHGPNTSVFKRAIAKAGGPSASDKDIINEIYDERGKRFPSSTPQVQASVKKRFKNERTKALAAL
jgi:hypothetical protein